MATKIKSSNIEDGAILAANLSTELKTYDEDIFTANGSVTEFTITDTPLGDNQLLISLDGVIQPTSAYDVANNVVTISPALPDGVEVRIVHLGIRGNAGASGGSGNTSVSELSDLSDVASTVPNSGEVLKWNGSAWAPATDATSSGGSGIALTDLSVTTGSASGGGTLSYNNSNGVFTFAPTSLSELGIGSSDINFGANKILYANVYSNLVDLPSASTYHGMFAHVHATGKGYFAHAGNWVELANASDIPTVPTNISDLSDVSDTSPTSGQILKWDGSQWAPASDLTSDGGSGIALTDLSVTTATASGGGSLSYNNATGVFTFTPADVSGVSYSNSDVDTHLNTSTANTNEVLSWNGSDYDWVAQSSGGSGISNVVEDTTPQLGGDLDVNGNTIQHTFTIGANGSSDYTFSDAGNVWFPTTENDPVLYLRRGEQYVFVNNSGGAHPFEIRQSAGGSAYSTGVTNNGAASGNIVFKVPMSAPSTLYYQCTVHSSMGNTINIV